jgi:hypothetical protein
VIDEPGKYLQTGLEVRYCVPTWSCEEINVSIPYQLGTIVDFIDMEKRSRETVVQSLIDALKRQDKDVCIPSAGGLSARAEEHANVVTMLTSPAHV